MRSREETISFSKNGQSLFGQAKGKITSLLMKPNGTEGMSARNMKLFCCPKSRIHFEKTKENPSVQITIRRLEYLVAPLAGHGMHRAAPRERLPHNVVILIRTMSEQPLAHFKLIARSFRRHVWECTARSHQLPCVIWKPENTPSPSLPRHQSFTKNKNHNFSKLIIILLCVTLQPKLDYSYTIRVAEAGCECSCMRHKCANTQISMDEWETMCASTCRMRVNLLHFIPLFSQNGAPGSKYTCTLSKITRFWEYICIYVATKSTAPVAHIQV